MPDSQTAVAASPPRALTLRPAVVGDTGLILRFVRELAAHTHMLHEAEATEAILRDHMFERGGAEAVIAEIDGAPVGMALFHGSFSTFTGKTGLYLEDLFVAPGARGQGVGRALVCHLARLVVQRGGARLEWTCLDWNDPARAFYERLGASRLEDATCHRVSGDALRRLAR